MRSMLRNILRLFVPTDTLCLCNGSVGSDDRNMVKRKQAESALLRVKVIEATKCELEKEITERKRVEAVLYATQERLQHLISSGPAIIYSSKPDGDYGITFISENVTSQLGYKAQEFIEDSRFWANRVHPEDAPLVFAEFSQLFEQGHKTCEYRFLHKNGSYQWIQDELKLVKDATGKALEILGCWQDITARKQAEAEIYKHDRLLRGVAEATNYLLTSTDYDKAFAKALEILGSAAGVDRVYTYQNHPHPKTGETAMSMRFEWTREPVEPIIHKSHWQNQPYSAFGLIRWYDALSAGYSINGIVRKFPKAEREILDRDGVLSLLLVPILIDGEFWGYIGFDDCHSEHKWSNSDESILFAMAAGIGGALKRQRAEEQLIHHAFHDVLTDLPNRALFMNRLGHAVSLAKRREDYLFAVLFVDLDRFKVINDSLGHMAGDQLLVAIASRLKKCLRPGDTVARLGGDEFTILLEDIKDARQAASVAERIQMELALPFNLSGHEVFSTASIGIALSTISYEHPEDLLRDANTAMHRAKELGRARHEVFGIDMHIQAVMLLQLETDLRRAVERQEFQIHYQPIVSLKNSAITGFEAVVRWQHPQRGLIYPAEFIPVAEETGLILPIGQWVLRQACQQMHTWQKQFPADRLAATSPLTLSINLSGKQFSQPDLVEQIQQILQETGLKARSLKLEITESVIMENAESATAMLLQLQALGIELYMDDFGTGYSSLSYLHHFPVDTLKIDRSFVNRIGVDDESSKIVQTLITLAHILGMNVIAEGVETMEQLLQLKELGCEYGQGYFFSKPLNSVATEVVIAGHCSKSVD